MKVLRIFDKTFGNLQPVLIPVNQIKYVKRGTTQEYADWRNSNEVYNTISVALLDGEIINGIFPEDENVTDILEGAE